MLKEESELVARLVAPPPPLSAYASPAELRTRAQQFADAEMLAEQARRVQQSPES